MTMTTMSAPPQAAPVAVEQEIIIQSQDLEGNRWSDLRSDMVSIIAGIATKLGFTMVPSEELLKMGFPVDDDSRFDDGTLDVDFEESAIEALLKFQRDGLKFAQVSERFAHNLKVRNHEPLQTS